jgi:hypothetical protein
MANTDITDERAHHGLTAYRIIHHYWCENVMRERCYYDMRRRLYYATCADEAMMMAERYDAGKRDATYTMDCWQPN